LEDQRILKLRLPEIGTAEVNSYQAEQGEEAKKEPPLFPGKPVCLANFSDSGFLYLTYGSVVGVCKGSVLAG
jgi:hypothetical protein